MQKLTKDIFIERSRKIHGNYYDYSLVNYSGNHVNVEIICPKHGVFMQTPSSHMEGQGCPLCGKNRKKKLIRGVAVNDTEYTISDPALKKWKDLLKRCFPKSQHEKEVCSSYKNCKICKEWLYFSNFKKWYDDNNIDGYCLDKDLLSDPDNKIYSPDTCCFLPQELNKLLTYKKEKSRRLAKRFFCKSKGCFVSKISMDGKSVFLGSVSSEEEAISLYKKAKKEYIDTKAKRYFDKGLISERIYKAFLKYKINYE